MIRYVLSSGSIPWTMDNEKKVKIARKRGFEGVELILTRRALKQIDNSRQMEGIFSLHEPFREGKGLPFDKIAFLDLQPFEYPWNYRRYFQIADTHGIPIVCHINGLHFEKFEKASQKSNQALLEFNTFDVMYDKKFTPEDFLEIAERNKSGICFDVGYAHQAGWNLAEAFLNMKEWIRIIHIYDVRRDDPQSSAHKNFEPGKGILPLEKFLFEVKISGWEGQVTFELLPQPLTCHKRALNYVKDRLL